MENVDVPGLPGGRHPPAHIPARVAQGREAAATMGVFNGCGTTLSMGFRPGASMGFRPGASFKIILKCI